MNKSLVLLVLAISLISTHAQSDNECNTSSDCTGSLYPDGPYTCCTLGCTASGVSSNENYCVLSSEVSVYTSSSYAASSSVAGESCSYTCGSNASLLSFVGASLIAFAALFY